MSDQAQPNIILMVSDQHRSDWMSHLGDQHAMTPHMDALAERGSSFTNMCCNYPLCGPSRMSFLTGRQPWRNGITINEHSLSSDIPCIPHALGLAGYESVLAGRMHFNGADQRHGFEKRLVGDICRCYAGGPIVDQEDLPGTMANLQKATELAGPRDNFVTAYDEDVTSAAERYISERADERPLFLTVGWYSPHHPYNAEPEKYDTVAERLAAIDDQPIAAPQFDHPHHGRLAEKYDFLADEEAIKRVRANYAALIETTDDFVGRICAAAEQLSGPTIVIYTSDHGESACDHGLLGKGTFFNPSLRVPFIVAPLRAEDGAALGITAGQQLSSMSSLVDLAPTVCALAGADPLPLQDGDDLSPLLRDQTLQEKQPWAERPVFSELAIHLAGGATSRMVQRGPWKYIWYDEGQGAVLHHLDDDPDERHNLIDKPEHQELIKALHALLHADGWSAAYVNAVAADKAANLKLMTRWGREIGYGPDEVWSRENPRYIL